ncbi:DEAD/DEAH box helicase [Nakamurella deserti]|uniref:DEAD/DEAH box helicase n=1 Tax=Nakamurella deserti TaxID=2164074 RepID=UPI000DBE6666|nr:DEAD/DEAH box helicase [Nakamurella deserti]
MVSPAVPALSASTTDTVSADLESADLTFADLGLPEALMKAVADLGYTTPSPIQAAAIPALLAGQDITGVAQTGTGKTAAFGLPLLAAMDPSSRDVQALVLTPTRELALQVSEAIETMAKHLPQVRVLAVYGGASFVPQLKALSSGVQVVVGTPGRIIDHLDRGTLKLGNLKFLVLDEADEMLRMGFAEDVENILTNAPKTGRQTALFSATMPPPIKRVADQHMTNPIDIAVSRQSSTVENVKQTYAVIPFSRKTDALARVIEISAADATIVFTRTKDAAENVGSELIARGISAATISGDVAQRERERIVERLRNGQLDVLVATDVAARGLDVDRIDLVVNYDAPGEPETYVHRIGRTGRAGRTGEALTFFTPRETGRLRVIEKLTRQKLTEITLPTASEVSAQRAIKVLTKAAARAEAGNIESYRTAIETFLTDSPLSVAELASALAALVAGDTGKQVAEPEVLVSGPRSRDDRGDRGDRGGRSFDRDRGDRGDRGGRSFDRDRGDRFGSERPRSDRRPSDRGGRDSSRPSGKRYSIAVGHADGVRPAGIVGAITAEGGLQGRDLGRIDIFDNHSIVEIISELTPAAFSRIGAARVSGRELRIKRHYEDATAAAPAKRSFRD